MQIYFEIQFDLTLLIESGEMGGQMRSIFKIYQSISKGKEG